MDVTMVLLGVVAVGALERLWYQKHRGKTIANFVTIYCSILCISIELYMALEATWRASGAVSFCVVASHLYYPQ